jgi:ATP-dependent exoDNAse (exonuclease V) beta subunit
VSLRVRDVVPLPPITRDATPGLGYAARGTESYPPAVVVPSDMPGPDGEVDLVAAAAGLALERYGERLILSGDPEMQRLGEAIHGFLAADRPTLTADERRGLARGLLGRWTVDFALQPDDLVKASDRLRVWIDTRWPEAIWHREWPLLHRQPNGTIVRGTADLVIEHADGFAVIDHKSFPGSAEQAAQRALGYTGQLAAYAAAVAAATGRVVTECFIHLPVLGSIVPVPVPSQR